MPRTKKGEKRAGSSRATIVYEARLWQMADALRNNMDAAENKHVGLGLIFVKYISDWCGGRLGRCRPRGYRLCSEWVCP